MVNDVADAMGRFGVPPVASGRPAVVHTPAVDDSLRPASLFAGRLRVLLSLSGSDDW